MFGKSEFRLLKWCKRVTDALKGLLHCSASDRAMVHTFTQKDEKLYRYYTCTNVIKNGRGKCPSPHLPAGEIEKAVIEQIRAIGADF